MKREVLINSIWLAFATGITLFFATKDILMFMSGVGLGFCFSLFMHSLKKNP